MAKKVPEYTFSGESSSEMIDGVWYIYLKSTGILNMKYGKRTVDIFMCGGGGGGGNVATGEQGGGGGGAGAYQTTEYGIAVTAEPHTINVGLGGQGGKQGEETTAFGLSAKGGGAGTRGTNSWEEGAPGSSDGTAAGGTGGWYWDGANTGYDGTAGKNGKQAFGVGTTYYCAGGGGGAWKSGTGRDGGNTGGTGGSGIVILRGTEDDYAPVWFDGVQVSEIFFNGEKVTGLIYGGARIFARRCVEWLSKRWACRFRLLRAIPAV